MADDPKGDGKVLSFTKRLEERLLRRSQEHGFSGSPEDAEFLDQVKPLQEAFQREHCGSCKKYDDRKQEYRKKGHPHDREDCHDHWTDILGACWNYRRREDDPHPEEHELEIFLQHIRPF